MTALVPSPIPQHMSAAAPNATPSSSRTRSIPHESPQQMHGSPRSNSSRDGSMSTMDIDAVLKSHGGDAKRALESVMADRTSLQSQNSQLWKLIEKQRSQCASLASDNERLRSDRERANSRLVGAGLEPVGGKKMSNSSSAMGLGLKAEAPTMRRHNSDREEKSIKEHDRITKEVDPPVRVKSAEAVDPLERHPRPSLTVPSPDASSQSSPGIDRASPTDKVYTSPLLPSPLVIQETKLRPQSRMVFPSEVSSWLSLADSPQNRHKDLKHPTPPSQLASSSSQTFIASPPVPSSSLQHSNVQEVESSRALARSTQVEEEDSPASAPDQAIPPRKSSIASPVPSETPPYYPRREADPPLYEEPAQVQQTGTIDMPQPRPQSPPPGVDLSRSSTDTDNLRQSLDTKPAEEASRGADPPQRNLPRLSSALLPHARISIPTSTVYPNAHGRDVLCFIVSVVIRPPNAQPVSWSVSKLFSAFIDLDTRIKERSGKARKEWKSMVAPLPDGKAWKDFAPSKIDQRKAALETYLQSLLMAPISDKSALCDFLSTDPVQMRADVARKEGYLTKKGKNFGGWKTRYFVLAGPVMEYYDSRGGPHLGSITITNAQIGRQNRPTESTDDRDFRHAFLIIEQTKRGTTNRHVLCAESDMERDAWIDLLVRYVDPEAAKPPIGQIAPPPPPPPSQPPPSGLTRRRSNSRKSSKDVVITAAAPMGGLSASGSKFSGAPSPSMINNMEQKRAQGASDSSRLDQNASVGPRDIPNSGNQLSIPHSSSADLLSTSPSSQNSQEPTPRSVKRQSIMPSRNAPPPSHSAAYLSKVAADGLQAPPGHERDRDRDRKAKSGRFWPTFGKSVEKVHRPVFGIPLSDSIQIASKAGLPAIVYRCIEYLEAKKAETEEGIYRLSGSSAVIKGLKDRFDAEGDVNLVKVDDRWDPHAIAGLLKTFLRELPMSLLTLDLHPRFLAVMDLIDSSARVAELAKLVQELPAANYALLRALTAHLILIVRNSAINKMTLRNIGIVFSPTLGIPAGIFSEMVTSFGAIFDDEPVPASELASIAESSEETQETITRKRNSILYQAGGADALLGLGGRSLGPATEDSASEQSTDIEIESTPSARSDESLPSSITTPRAEAYPSPPTIRKPKAASRAADRGLVIDPSASGHPPNGAAGLPNSPRPPTAPAPGSAGLAPALSPNLNGSQRASNVA